MPGDRVELDEGCSVPPCDLERPGIVVEHVDSVGDALVALGQVLEYVLDVVGVSEVVLDDYSVDPAVGEHLDLAECPL